MASQWPFGIAPPPLGQGPALSRTIGAHGYGWERPTSEPAPPRIDAASGLQLPALSPQMAMGGDRYALITAAPRPAAPAFDPVSGLQLPPLQPVWASGGASQHSTVPSAPLPRGDGYSAGGTNHLSAPPPPLPRLTRSDPW